MHVLGGGWVPVTGWSGGSTTNTVQGSSMASRSQAIGQDVPHCLRHARHPTAETVLMVRPHNPAAPHE